ncbi:hypothetical protein EV130_101323 [Rhizobium azibense]|uniref:Sulphur transport domain-containing protein n=1 Tax=Rhizobium azibense TaxID=1136135 RepID=A0A4R3R6H0_9HYPH|nr:DUF6691 family protein [Rhizobium azibense]TCU30748.1 hypothetical protein EV130_101323 [Rhizobium azibense]
MSHIALQIVAALISGTLFGFGLSLSGMLDPARVQGFLDVFGTWDPSLGFVLAGAVTVAFAGVSLSRLMRRPVLNYSFDMPRNRKIDAPLIIGSAIFGLGWGLGGFCPGPAIAALPLGFSRSFGFVFAMLVGMAAHDRLLRRST